MGEPESKPSLSGGAARAAIKAAPVIIVGSVMFSFISYWRVAAVVLGVKLRPLGHRGDVVDRRLDAVARLVATSGARLRLGSSGHG